MGQSICEEPERARPILNSRMRVRKEDVGYRKRAHWLRGGEVSLTDALLLCDK